MSEDDALPGRPNWALWPLSDAMRLRAIVCMQDSDASRGFVLTDEFPADLLRQAVSRRCAGVALSWSVTSAERLDACLAQGERDYRALTAAHAFSDIAPERLRLDAHAISVETIARSDSPVLKLLDATLFDAYRAHASDVHFENSGEGMRIRQRLDGVMRTVGTVASHERSEQLVSRLKVLAELDIGEARLPQDGRFKLNVADRDVDFRLSIMPTAYGEDAVVRLLDRGSPRNDRAPLSLESLGFDADDCDLVRAMARRPYGMLIVTGPTGSGKTTTLYAVIGEINEGLDKIITIEDPVEYQLSGVVQIPVNEKKGLTFARGLRSVLRHDPDRVMVGEIRDTETAQIATQAALTGHMVLTTIHASNALDVVGRLMHMGLDLYNLVAALHGVLAQRLLRRVCSHCAVAATLSGQDVEMLERFRAAEASDAVVPEERWMRACGCAECFGTGYRGRRAVAEILQMDDVLRDLIAGRAPMSVLKEQVRGRGARSLRQAAIRAARMGHTTLEEVRRVTLAD